MQVLNKENATKNQQVRGMFVALSISTWGARKHDKEVSHEVANSYHTDDTAGNFNKNLLASTPEYKEVILATARARTNCHYKYTLPHLIEGLRILPNDLYFEYCAEMNMALQVINESVDKFIAAYPRLVAERIASGNGLFKDTDFPPVTVLRSKFAFDITLIPIADASAFQVDNDLGVAESEAIASEYKAKQDQMLSTASRDIWNRLHEVVKNMVDGLSRYGEPGEKRAQTFRNSLVSNISDMVSLAGKLNFTGDDQIEQIRNKIAEELTIFDAEALRGNDGLRLSTKVSAEKILETMSAFI